MQPRRILRLAIGLSLPSTLCVVSLALATPPEFAPSTKQTFTSTSGTSLLTGRSISVKCTSGTNSGEVTGSKTVGKLLWVFTGCREAAALNPLCTVKSVGAAKEGEIVMKTLKGELGTSKEAADGIALLLLPDTSKVLATLMSTKCAGESSIEGNVAAEVLPLNGTSGTLVFAASPPGSIKSKIKKFNGKTLELTAFGGEVSEETIDTLKFTTSLEVTGTLPPSSEENLGAGNPGSPTKAGEFTGSLINVATGNLVETQADLSVRGRGPGLNVTRTYNSLLASEASEPGTFGYGWTGPYGAFASITESSERVAIHQGNGSVVVFRLIAGKYVPGTWVQATLVKSGSNYVYTLPDQTTQEFNSSGQFTNETDRNGNAITLSYNSTNKRLETATDGDSRKLTFVYNSEGQVERITDPMGRTVKYTYSAKELETVSLPGEASARWRFAYDASHQLTTLTDGRGNAITTDFDGSHRVSHQADPLKRQRTLKYATIASGTETKLTEPNGSETVEQFNTAAEPTKITRASGTGSAATAEYQYNNALVLTVFVDPNKHTTKYTNNSSNDRTRETDPNGNETKWTYDATHDVETTTTPKGATTTIKRDGKGNPETIERAAPGGESQKTIYKYNGTGDVTEILDPLKHTTKYEYDAAGDRKSARDPEGNEQTWKYNEDSEETSEISPRGNVEGAEASKYATTIKRDEQGRPTKVTDPLGHASEWTYDENGNVETFTDGNGHKTKYTYNADNQLTKTEEPNKTLIETGYDSEGLVTSQTDGNSNTTEYKRNLLEEVEEEVDPLKRTTNESYDTAGNLKSVEDPMKRTATYKYDTGNRMTEVSYSSGTPSTVKYEYDQDGAVKKMNDGTGETLNTYDELDRLTESKDGNGDVVKYEYNLNDLPTKITYPNAKAVKRTYDKDSRLEKVIDWNSKTTKFAYDANSNLTATVFPSGTEDEDTYAYNEADQMSEVKMAKGTSKLGTLAYTRDSDGQLKETTTTVLPGPATIKSTYDENNRLTSSGGSTNKYDKANNPTELEGTTYIYDKADELETGTGLTFTFNEDGQRTKTKPTVGPATTYGYDQIGNLTSVSRSEEGSTKKIEDSYGFDGNHLRSSQTINGTTTHLSWDTAEELPLILSDENNHYIYGADGLPIEQLSSGGTTLYLHHDQQGSTRLITSSAGASETAYTYDPYGKVNATTGTATTPLRYDGQYTDTDTGLIYLRARSLDTATGQFISRDKDVAKTGAPYSYAGDNPLNSADPTGDQQIQIPGGLYAPWGFSLGPIQAYGAAVVYPLPNYYPVYYYQPQYPFYFYDMPLPGGYFQHQIMPSPFGYSWLTVANSQMGNYSQMGVQTGFGGAWQSSFTTQTSSTQHLGFDTPMGPAMQSSWTSSMGTITYTFLPGVGWHTEFRPNLGNPTTPGANNPIIDIRGVDLDAVRR